MSTRCAIAYKDPETETIKAIYCHFDGYVKGVGETLKNNYKDLSKVKALISLGDISTLGEDITNKKGTFAYSRDGGEEYRAPREYEDEYDYYADYNRYSAEYMYLYTDDIFSKDCYRWFYIEIPMPMEV